MSRSPKRVQPARQRTTAPGPGQVGRSRAPGLATAGWGFAAVALVLIGVLTYLMTLTTRPEISGITPDPNSSQPPGSVMIGADVNSPRSIEEAILIIDEQEITPSITEEDDSRWRIEHEQVLDRGNRQITLKVTDSSGRTAEHSWAFDSSGDLIEPRIVLESPPSGVLVAPGDNGVLIRATTFADIDTIDVTFGDESVPAEVEEIGRGTEYSDQEDLPVFEWQIKAETRLSGGRTEINAEISDEHGATATATWALSVANDESAADARFFRRTGQYLIEPFLSYWDDEDGESTIGPPISPPIAEGDGDQVQYFRFARLEEDSEGVVHRGLIGRELFGEPENPPDRAPGSGARQFEATGHYIIGTVREFWEENGGIATFGYPVSQEFETDNGYAQYFERAMIEVVVLGSTEIVELAPLGERLYETRLRESSANTPEN
jgi:hypothetical protein